MFLVNRGCSPRSTKSFVCIHTLPLIKPTCGEQFCPQFTSLHLSWDLCGWHLSAPPNIICEPWTPGQVEVPPFPPFPPFSHIPECPVSSGYADSASWSWPMTEWHLKRKTTINHLPECVEASIPIQCLMFPVQHAFKVRVRTKHQKDT